MTEDLDKFPLYFDIDKISKIDIKIEKDKTCQDILNKNQQIIQNKITDNSILIKNDFDDYKIYFIIINSDYPRTRLKLKPKDRPRKYLDSSKKSSLYFISIPTKNNKIENKNQNNNTTKTIQLSNNKTKAKIINYVRPEDCIREGQLKKYNFGTKKFEIRRVNIDKYKIIMSYSNDSNLWKVIYLNDIKTIIKGTKEQQIKNQGDLFEITLSDSETFIFKANNSTDREEWYKVINSFVIQIKENNYLYSLTLTNNNILKDLYKEQMNIIFNYLSLKGVLSLEKTRKVYYGFLGNYILQQVLEKIVNYKLSINRNDYLQSFRFFKEIMDFLDIKNFKLETYNDNKYDLKKNSKNLDPQNSKEITKEFILKNMNTLKTLKVYHKILKVFQEIFSKGNFKMDNKDKTFVDTLKKYLKSNTLSELFDNVVSSIHRHFHNKVVKDPEFLFEIKRALIYYFKPENFSVKIDYISLPPK